MRGYTTREMMKELKVTESTMKAHLKRIYALYDIDNSWVKRVRLIYLIYKHSRRKLWDEEDRQA